MRNQLDFDHHLYKQCFDRLAMRVVMHAVMRAVMIVVVSAVRIVAMIVAIRVARIVAVHPVDSKCRSVYVPVLIFALASAEILLLLGVPWWGHNPSWREHMVSVDTAANSDEGGTDTDKDCTKLRQLHLFQRKEKLSHSAAADFELVEWTTN